MSVAYPPGCPSRDWWHRLDWLRSGQTNDLTPMIEINEIIRDGLK